MVDWKTQRATLKRLRNTKRARRASTFPRSMETTRWTCPSFKMFILRLSQRPSICLPIGQVDIIQTGWRCNTGATCAGCCAISADFSMSIAFLACRDPAISTYVIKMQKSFLFCTRRWVIGTDLMESAARCRTLRLVS